MAPRKIGRVTSRVGTVYRDRDETYDVKLPGQVRDWQIKCVCGGTHLTCNGGWMRDIENEVKPILTNLILGKSALLSPDHQALIATWAVLKAIVSEYHWTSRVSTHWTQRRLIKNKKRPPINGWSVWIGHFERGTWRPEWLSNPFFVPSRAVQARRGIREPTYYNGTSVTQVIGKLFIQTIHIPIPFFTGDRIRRDVFSPTNGAIFRVWPDQLPAILWPQQPLSDLEADRIAGAMNNFLRSRAA